MKVILGIIAEGIVPFLFAEGSYNERLDMVSDLPKSSAIWWFDQTDMARAKSILGRTACIAGMCPGRCYVRARPLTSKNIAGR